MGSLSHPITPPPDGPASYSRPSPSQASADAIPILIDNTYHIFHLTTPPFTKHHPPRLRSSWSRIRSSDLVSWTRDPEPALIPSNDPNASDADGVWTGAATIAPDGCMTIFYTGYCLARGGRQVILRSKSSDRHGTAFEQPGKEITIEGTGLARFEDIDFRDPYVFFNEDEGMYWMLVATRLASGPHWTRGCIALLTSTDIDSWTVEPEPLYSPNDMLCPECPELFTLGNGNWYLVYSRFHAPDSGTVYRVADSPRGPFRVPRDGSHGRLDGRRWYAAKSCPKAGDPGKRVFFGWVGDYVDEEGKWLWGGDMGVPREVHADEQGNLQLNLAAEVRAHINQTYVPVSKALSSTLELESLGSTATTFPALNHAAQDLCITFDIQSCEAHSFGMLLHADNEGKAHKLVITPSQTSSRSNSFTVSLLADFPPLDDFWADQYKLYLPRSVDGPELVRHEGLDLSGGVTVLLKERVVQVFCGGRAISFRLPAPAAGAAVPTVPFGWFVEDGRVELSNLEVRSPGEKMLVYG